MNSRSASIVGDQEAAGSSSYAWCNRQWLSSQALTRRSSVRPKQAVFNHNLLWLPESNGYPLYPILISFQQLDSVRLTLTTLHGQKLTAHLLALRAVVRLRSSPYRFIRHPASVRTWVAGWRV